MVVGAMAFLYKRLGGWYPLVFLAVELQTALFIVAGTLARFSFYYEGSLSEYLIVLGIALVLTELAIVATVLRLLPRLRPLRRWLDGDRGSESTQRAWNAAIGLPLSLIKRGLPIPVIVSAPAPAPRARAKL